MNLNDKWILNLNNLYLFGVWYQSSNSRFIPVPEKSLVPFAFKKIQKAPLNRNPRKWVYSEVIYNTLLKTLGYTQINLSFTCYPYIAARLPIYDQEW